MRFECIHAQTGQEKDMYFKTWLVFRVGVNLLL